MLQEQEVRLMILLVSLAFLLVGFLLLFVVYFLRQKRQMELERQLKDQQRDQMILEAQMEIQEQTIRNIGQELHDNFGQVLSLIKINLNTLSYVDKETNKEKIQETKELAQQLISDIRSLSHSFSHNLIANAGLLQAIAFEVSRIQKAALLHVSFEAEELSAPPSAEKAIVLYRMVQEALNNALKHSAASELSVRIQCADGIMHITIADNGIGFDTSLARQPTGQGMSNLRTRAALIGAQLDVQSTPHKGTTVHIVFQL